MSQQSITSWRSPIKILENQWGKLTGRSTLSECPPSFNRLKNWFFWGSRAVIPKIVIGYWCEWKNYAYALNHWKGSLLQILHKKTETDVVWSCQDKARNTATCFVFLKKQACWMPQVFFLMKKFYYWCENQYMKWLMACSCPWKCSHYWKNKISNECSCTNWCV